jgi:hypothetical protein
MLGWTCRPSDQSKDINLDQIFGTLEIVETRPNDKTDDYLVKREKRIALKNMECIFTSEQINEVTCMTVSDRLEGICFCGDFVDLKYINSKNVIHEPSFESQTHRGRVSCMLYCNRGYLVTGLHDKSIRFWNLDNMKCSKVVEKAHSDHIT